MGKMKKKGQPEISLKVIGVVHSPYIHREDAPSQGFERETLSEIEIYPEYMKGISKIEAGDMLDVVYWMDRADRNRLWNERKKRGVFVSRSPDRPNPLGISPTVVVSVNENIITVKYLDALDGSCLVDIKHSLSSDLKKLKERII